MRALSLCLVLAPACTLNVEAISDEKTARYDGTDFATLRLETGDAQEPVHVRGEDQDFTEARAGVAALVSSDSGRRELRSAHLDLFKAGEELRLGLAHDGPEGMYLEWIDVQMPAAKKLDVTADSGPVTVTGMRGAVRVTTGSGSVVAYTHGTLHASVDSGDVRGAAAGGDVDVGSGDVELALRPGGTSPLRVSTDSGDVRLTLPRGLGVALHAQTGSGSIVVSAGGVALHDDDGEIWTALNGGGTRVDLELGSGDVIVLER